MASRYRIESLLSARLFLRPQLVGDRIFFVSNMSGRMSLYAMDHTGSVPEPLLPPQVALQNPDLMEGRSYVALPWIGKVLVMIDRDGDENYQPCFIPMAGGWPEPVFGDRFQGGQVVMSCCDHQHNLCSFTFDPRTDPLYRTFVADLRTGEATEVTRSRYGCFCVGADETYDRLVLTDEYLFWDRVFYLWERETGKMTRLFGKPIGERAEGEKVSPSGLGRCHFTPGGGLLMTTAVHHDAFGLGYLHLERPGEVQEVKVHGTRHEGPGEMEEVKHLDGERYLLRYNIDGCTWAYEGRFDESLLLFHCEQVICGEKPLADGVMESIHFDHDSGRFALSFSTATSPSQIYLVERGPGGVRVRPRTRERILGIPREILAEGEDVSYDSHDGLRVSARLYLPSTKLEIPEPFPVVFYIHGGPQSQERPDFTWFSMPLIQFFTLNGFAVYVPNARGSTGYGLDYMKRVERDEGGKDRLDHVHAFGLLRNDPRLDMERAGVMGRSYGGQMTLTLAGRHAELWKAACDMFGPYNLPVWLERIPETWKTYFHMFMGHPERDREFLLERSPSTHLDNLACPLLVIQGANDPRVIEQESRDLVNDLRAAGKDVEYLVFDNEGHDVIKYENRVACYNRIVDFFKAHLGESG